MGNAGRYGVNIGTGAVGGAATGAMFGPVGAAIGGGVGAIGGAISTLLSTSDEAKQRKQAEEAYLAKLREQGQDSDEQFWARMTGVSGDPMYQAMTHDFYDEGGARTQAQEAVAAGMPEPPPNYGALVQSLGQLGGTIGGLQRAGALEQQRIGQAQQNTRNPWVGYSSAFGGEDWPEDWSSAFR